MQPNEEIGQIFIIVIDETYGGDEDTWEEDSERYRVSLEHEFDVHFEEANVGPGADIPAFLTAIATTSVPLWSVLIGAFFLGKPINENLDAWADIGRKIKGFFKRPVVLARHGASVLAVEAVFDEMGGIPKSIHLLSYRPEYMGDLDSLAAIECSDKISENVPTLNLGFILHIFEIEADGQQFRVGVNGKITKVLRL
ncbi:hypothetical protein OIU34_11900 [Pararhizobium sp. BT-229]|uniref:hypothetical protein n=1 Tax=Pararhizobium sp. BT-229 TaxID=2986923 RepID=UPI0021F7D25E|nr:hypothetical protein [Pararhizobium sp. BT-229]MCV9962602.1 hypothetical protein [Pararhizobium sp. BT-229]